MKRKGLICYVYKNTILGDSTNSGITSKADRVLLVGGGIPEIFEESESMPTLEVRAKFVRDQEYIYAEPTTKPQGVGWMMGGNFIYSSDSRFHKICPYPIPVHDRCESRELYQLLSQ